MHSSDELDEKRSQCVVENRLKTISFDYQQSKSHNEYMVI